jgi:hypothetical protein
MAGLWRYPALLVVLLFNLNPAGAGHDHLTYGLLCAMALAMSASWMTGSR